MPRIYNAQHSLLDTGSKCFCLSRSIGIADKRLRRHRWLRARRKVRPLACWQCRSATRQSFADIVDENTAGLSRWGWIMPAACATSRPSSRATKKRAPGEARQASSLAGSAEPSKSAGATPPSRARRQAGACGSGCQPSSLLHLLFAFSSQNFDVYVNPVVSNRLN